eukprot:CAMPEP_0194135012 /NCGR_PEP_ID=MMETSP0152-20130528/5087_1 /TAXON_ID=1049557 /ORGANISM="Thalassiothrix antarctica, Strain L6-D1" /LENGTH=311 /DNA_ID=CAMNT_0038831015 /DNA_START=99 /DNA_END=1031 /DNA_ORIENTATION=-
MMQYFIRNIINYSIIHSKPLRRKSCRRIHRRRNKGTRNKDAKKFHQHHLPLKKRNGINKNDLSFTEEKLAAVKIEGNEDLMGVILSYLNVVTLTKKKLVSTRWGKLCIVAIDRKVSFSDKPFGSNRELKKKIRDYINVKSNAVDDNGNENENIIIQAEKLASTYGWPIAKWDVSQIEDFSHIFSYTRDFNEDIGLWDTSNAKNMADMFSGSLSFNQDISSWNTTNVNSMNSMFAQACSFNQDISSWNTCNVRNMDLMFYYASSFNQDISSWDTTQVDSMNSMFYYASLFNQDISSWNANNIRDMDRMFEGP